MPKIVLCDNLDNLYAVIAENIKRERKKLCISQAELAERADISIDTVKSVESGRREMSLNTFLRIVQALETTPMMLINGKGQEYMERFFFLVAGRDESEIEFVLHVAEHLLKGQEGYLK